LVGRRRTAQRLAVGGQPLLQLRDPRILLGQPRVLLGDPRLQPRDDPLLGRHERRQPLVGRGGRGPILHTASRITRSRHTRART